MIDKNRIMKKNYRKIIICCLLLVFFFPIVNSIASEPLIGLPKQVMEKSENKMTSLKDLFPDEIKCINVGTFYPGKGLPPKRYEELTRNNIIKSWNYKLAYHNESYGKPTNNLRLIFIGIEYDNRRKANPIPHDINSLWIDIDKPENLTRNQRNLGIYSCLYANIKDNDIFPLSDSLYYLSLPLAKKLKSHNDFTHTFFSPLHENVSISFKRNNGTLCIPLVENNAEFMGCSHFTCYYGLNATVTRIYSVPTDNKSTFEYVARVCLSEEPNMVGYELGQASFGFPGESYSYIENYKSNNVSDYERFKREVLTIQEVRVGDILKGNGYGYKITSIIPQFTFIDENNFSQPKEMRVIGWVEFDSTPILLDKNGFPFENSNGF
jgi:hypothetical protein